MPILAPYVNSYRRLALGQVAPINVPFYADRSTISDGVTLTKQQADEVLAGLWYVNVMTEKYPDGEIRGQIVPLKK